MDNFDLPKYTFFRLHEWIKKFPFIIWSYFSTINVTVDNILTLHVAYYLAIYHEFTEIVLWSSCMCECYILMPYSVQFGVWSDRRAYRIPCRTCRLYCMLFAYIRLTSCSFVIQFMEKVLTWHGYIEVLINMVLFHHHLWGIADRQRNFHENSKNTGFICRKHNHWMNQILWNESWCTRHVATK
jgi:hypothetical protein